MSEYQMLSEYIVMVTLGESYILHFGDMLPQSPYLVKMLLFGYIMNDLLLF